VPRGHCDPGSPCDSGSSTAAPRGARPPSSFQRQVQRSSLREQVAGALREEMMAGRLAAGTHFTVKQIAEMYGVSATPVREALLDLAAQDLLWIEHNRGFSVPELSWADYLDVVEARTLVTDGMFRRLGKGIRHVDWSRMPSLQRRAEAAARAARNGQLDVLVGCDRRFWGELAGLMGNRKLADYLDWLRVQYWIFAAPHLRGRDDVAAYCWADHVELTDRLRAKDRLGVHRMLMGYNRQSLEQMAALCGESLDDGTVAGFLRSYQPPGTEPPNADTDTDADTAEGAARAVPPPRLPSPPSLSVEQLPVL
jgi:DNA-binding GntR family transcriptional regulator